MGAHGFLLGERVKREGERGAFYVGIVQSAKCRVQSERCRLRRRFFMPQAPAGCDEWGMGNGNAVCAARIFCYI
jgi:hypothetical protein